MFVLGVVAALAADVQIVGTELQLFDHAPALVAQWPDADVVFATHNEAAPRTTLASASAETVEPYQAALPGATFTPLEGEAGAPVVVTLGMDLDPVEATSQPISSFQSQPVEVRGFVGDALVFEGDNFGCCGSWVGAKKHVWIVGPTRLTPYLLASELAELAELELSELIEGAAAGTLEGYAADVRQQLVEPSGRARAFAEATRGMKKAVADTGSVELRTTFGPTIEATDGRALVDSGRDCGERATLTAEVPRPSGGTHVLRADIHDTVCNNMVGQVTTGSRVQVWWSADRTHAAALVQGGGHTMGFRSIQVVPLPVARPAVEVMYKTTDPARRAAVQQTLADAGYVPAGPTPAMAHRDTVQVFARKGFETEGAAVAEALGAGAPEPLTWDAAGDLVVALP